MKIQDWADRSWLLSKPELAAEYSVKRLTMVILTLLALTLMVI